MSHTQKDIETHGIYIGRYLQMNACILTRVSVTPWLARALYTPHIIVGYRTINLYVQSHFIRSQVLFIQHSHFVMSSIKFPMEQKNFNQCQSNKTSSITFAIKQNFSSIDHDHGIEKKISLIKTFETIYLIREIETERLYVSLPTFIDFSRHSFDNKAIEFNRHSSNNQTINFIRHAFNNQTIDLPYAEYILCGVCVCVCVGTCMFVCRS